MYTDCILYISAGVNVLRCVSFPVYYNTEEYPHKVPWKYTLIYKKSV